MIWHWIHHPAGYYTLLGLGLVACVQLFVTLKREIWLLNSRLAEKQQALDQAMQRVERTACEISQRLSAAEERAGVLVPPAPPSSGLNLSKRSQALRMSRRGDAPQHIAAALGVCENEVKLLLKIHRIILERA
jgi:hypothetical protein